MQQDIQERKALVHRGGIGIGPHVQAASLLLHAVVEAWAFFVSRRPARQSRQLVASEVQSRAITPIFIEGTLCERVNAVEEDGEAFCLCFDEIPSDAYTCRRGFKSGRWVYYCHPDDA